MKFVVGLLAWAQLLGILSADSLQESIQALKTYKEYPYPYENLEKDLKSQNKKTILIFNYGSLLDLCSASKTFSKKSLATRRLAVAFGTKRVFDRDVPINPRSKWGVPISPESRAMLNLVRTGDLKDVTNGILMNVDIDDIPFMRKREEGYELVPIIVSGWQDYLTNKNPRTFIAYTFHAKEGTRFTSSHIYPRPGYYELARDAAKIQGPIFYQMWLNSTFLADKKQPISVWEEAIRNCSEKTLIIEKDNIFH